MAFSNTTTALLWAAGIVLTFLGTWVVTRYLGKDLFGILGGLFKSKKEEVVQTKVVPDDEVYRIINEKVGFNELVNGHEINGKNERTGVEMMRFKYGDNRLTDWEVPHDKDYFRPDVRNLEGRRPLVYYVMDTKDAVVRLKNDLANVSLYNKGLQNKVELLYQDEKMRMQQTQEFQRDEKRIALGWSGGTGYQNDYRFKPRYGWGGGGGAPQASEGNEDNY